MKWLATFAAGVTGAIALLVAMHFPFDRDAVADPDEWLERADYRRFYDSLYAPQSVPSESDSGTDPSDGPIEEFVRSYGLEHARVLEVGAGSGELQDVVANYTGLDISETAGRNFHKPFVRASATAMPFRQDDFDALWTIDTLEHVPRPERALSEIRRVVKDGGLVYLKAAWQCRPWTAQGYHVRPYSDLGVGEKIIKLSIPLRESIAFRALYTFPIRLIRLATALASPQPTSFRYRRLAPNYEHYWDADSDAINSMDPYEAILWFRSRGDEILSFDGPIAPLWVRSGAIVVRVQK